MHHYKQAGFSSRTSQSALAFFLQITVRFHTATKTQHQLPLIEFIFPPFIFLHRRPFSCLEVRRTWWDDVKEDVWRGQGESQGNRLIKVNPACVCESQGLN